MPSRPQTAAVRSKGLDEAWMTDANFDLKGAEDEIDRELAEMMQRNQARLTELHTDFKQVSKLVEEPYVNVRKLKQPNVIARKKQASRVANGAVDENMDAQNV